MVVDVESRSNLEMFLREKIVSGLNMGSKGESSVKDGTPTSGLHNSMADYIPWPRILKEDQLGLSGRNMSEHVSLRSLWDIQEEKLSKKLNVLSRAQMKGLKWRRVFENHYIDGNWSYGHEWIPVFNSGQEKQKGIRTSHEKLQLVEDKPAKESKEPQDN